MAIEAIPVILDTDIGTDIDDTWALAMLLKCPELDLKLVVSDTGDTVYRAELMARMLEIAERTDVPVAVGIDQGCKPEHKRQAEWVEDYSLDQYPGEVRSDGVQALVDAIMQSSRSITLLCIGPMPNIARALEIEPGIAGRTNFVGMHGSINWSHHGAGEQIAEYNVHADIAACQQVFEAPWKSMTITPLDTCGRIRLTGEKYAKVRNSDDPLVKAVIDNYRIWAKQQEQWDCATESSVLFDTVAVHLGFSTKYLKMQQMPIRVDDRGFTVVDPGAQRMNVAIDWQDMAAYEDYLVEQLVG